MNVLSLFDGISTGRLVLSNLRIPLKNYYASEVDKYAIAVSKDNWDDIEHLGDIENWRRWGVDFSSVDLVLAGSPCQGFSLAGKQAGFKDSRSRLFYVFVEILNHIRSLNPNVKFLLENVSMKPAYLDVITKELNVLPVRINSKTITPQLRDRYYWCNWDVDQPVTNDTKFQDVLESDQARVDKAYALTATYYKKGAEATRQRNFNKSQRPIAWIDNENTRWLTPIECERLQGLPDNYTDAVSNTRRYMCIGNGWSVAIVEHILSSVFYTMED